MNRRISASFKFSSAATLLAEAAFIAGVAVVIAGCGSSSSAPVTGAGAPGAAGAPAAGSGNSTDNGGSAVVSMGGSSYAGTGVSAGGVVAANGGNPAGGSSSFGGASGGGTPSGGAPGVAGAAGGSSTAPTGSCAMTAVNQHPFGCKFGWGIADPGGSLASYSYVQFVSYWVDSSISAAGTYTTCNGCNWIKNNVASTSLIPAYYAYIIGFLAHANGIVDGNQTGGKKLTTDGAALVKANRAAIIAAYGWYAKETYKVWPTKPLVWLMEGDFVQFADSGQSSPLTYTEVGQLAADISCAIKSNMPNAVIAIDHSSWNSDDVTNKYWGAMKNVNYDLVWGTGVGNNNGYIEAGTNSSTYNHATATYTYLHTLTGRSILIDTSAGASAAGDSWSTASATDLNARISEGVIAANISGTAPSGLQGNISKLSGLSPVPNCQ